MFKTKCTQQEWETNYRPSICTTLQLHCSCINLPCVWRGCGGHRSTGRGPSHRRRCMWNSWVLNSTSQKTSSKFVWNPATATVAVNGLALDDVVADIVLLVEGLNHAKKCRIQSKHWGAGAAPLKLMKLWLHVSTALSLTMFRWKTGTSQLFHIMSRHHPSSTWFKTRVAINLLGLFCWRYHQKDSR